MRCAILFGLIFLISYIILNAQPFDNDKYLDTSRTNIYYQWGRIAIDTGGNPGICWIEESYDSYWMDYLLYSKSSDHGNSFERVPVDSFGCPTWDCHLGHPELVYDSENNVWLTYISDFENSYSLEIKKSTDGGASFTSTSLLFWDMSSPQYSITADNNGNFYILWALYDEMLRCTKIKNGNLLDTATVIITEPDLKLRGIDICSAGGDLYAVFGGK